MKIERLFGVTTKVIIVGVLLALAIPSVIYAFPRIAGADSSYVILGGSMEPALQQGDVALVGKAGESTLAIGDVVLVTNEKTSYLHRIVEMKELAGETVLKLQGDANEAPDPGYVNASMISGELMSTLPTGVIFTPYGYGFFIFTPLALLVGKQVIRVNKFYEGRKRKIRRGFKAFFLGKSAGRQRKPVNLLDGTSIALLMIFLMGSAFLIAPFYTSTSRGIFTDTKTRELSLGAGAWKVPSHLTCEVTVTEKEIPIFNGSVILHGVNIHGRLRPNLENESILIQVRRTGPPIPMAQQLASEIGMDFYPNNLSSITQGWFELGTVETREDGTYSMLIGTFLPGVYEFRAKWSGNSDFLEVTSEPYSITVPLPVLVGLPMSAGREFYDQSK